MANKASVSAGAISANAGTSGTGGAASGGGAILSGGGGGDAEDGRYRCFLGPTLITLSNNHQVPIHMVNPKDYVMVPQPNGDIKPGRVNFKQTSLAKEWLQVYVAGRWTDVKLNHRFRAPDGRWIEVAKLDHVIQRVHGIWELVPIDEKRVKRVEHDAMFYNLGVEDPAHAYIAAGCWVSNIKPLEEEII